MGKPGPLVAQEAHLHRKTDLQGRQKMNLTVVFWSRTQLIPSAAIESDGFSCSDLKTNSGTNMVSGFVVF
jgi:hypothetical protein